MPFKPRRPAGGFRVMYEYANRLSLKGYDVHLTYPIRTQFMEYRFPYWVRCILSKIEGFRTNKWFNFNPQITMSYVNYIDDKYVTDADIVITTWWATALEVGRLSKSKGKKINLIQGYENWTGHEELLHKSYNMPDTINVVVANYLKQVVAKYSNNQIVTIPNAIDNSQFYITNKIEDRIPYNICMLYSIQEIKGSKYGIEALLLVKKKYPELKVYLFGVCPKPTDLPDWMEFHREPKDLTDIHNRNAIFVSNSLTEGFGLVSVEAMLCGCALVCTDIDGHKEYATDRETAMLVDVKNPQMMADRICYLIENNDFRIQLAKNGDCYVQRFSWNKTMQKMQELIESL